MVPRSRACRYADEMRLILEDRKWRNLSARPPARLMFLLLPALGEMLGRIVSGAEGPVVGTQQSDQVGSGWNVERACMGHRPVFECTNLIFGYDGILSQGDCFWSVCRHFVR
jgi:hypothetical protein